MGQNLAISRLEKRDYQLLDVNMADLEDDLNRVSVELESPLLADQQSCQSFRTVRSGEE